MRRKRNNDSGCVILGLGLALFPACGGDSSPTLIETGDETDEGSTAGVDSEVETTLDSSATSSNGDGDAETDADADADADADTGDGDTTTTGDGDGDGDGGGPLPPADPGEWQWIDVPGAKCRSGSQHGIGYRYGTVNKLVVYLQGGNACFNFTSCLVNSSSVDSTEYSVGLMNQDHPDNPVAGWHQVFIPQCTGDVYSGNNEGVEHEFLPQLDGPQDFVGFINVQLALDYIVPTFEDVEQVLWSGYSAGGFGAAWNYDSAQQAFGDVPVVLLDDAGPPMAVEYFTECLQDHMNLLWGWTVGGTFPDDCVDCDNTAAGGVMNYFALLNEKYPDSSLGLVTSYEDYLIRQFWGYGVGCDLNSFIPPTYAGSMYREGLEDLRDNWATGPQWGTFFVAGDQHTFTSSDADFFSAEADGVLLTDWVQDLLDGNQTHVADP